MEEKTGKADKKEIRSRKNQKLYRSRFGKEGKAGNCNSSGEPRKPGATPRGAEGKRYDDHKYPWIWKPEGISSDVPWSGNRGQNASEG